MKTDIAIKENWFWATLEFTLTLLFITLVGGLFVSLAIMLGKFELITLVYVLLLGALLRPVASPKIRRRLEKLPVIGEANDVYNDLEKYYLSHRKKPFLYYLCYPVSGIVSFFFSRKEARLELNAYFSLIQWMIFLLLVEGFASYFRFYKYFEWDFALQWFYLELLTVYFLCNFFAVPIATTSLHLSIQGKKIRLFMITLFSLLLLSFFCYFFVKVSRYENLIPINIIMDKRIAQAKGQNSDPFLTDLEDSTKMFLEHRAEDILEFNRTYFFHENRKIRQDFFQEINNSYQKHLSSIAILSENEHFFLTTTQERENLWGIVCLPFRESIFYIFSYQDNKLDFFQRWENIPSQHQEKLRLLWDKDTFQFSVQKQFARVVVDYMRKEAKKSQAPKQKMSAGEEESTFSEVSRKSLTNREKIDDILGKDTSLNWATLRKEYLEKRQKLILAWSSLESNLSKSLPWSKKSFPEGLSIFSEEWKGTWQIAGQEGFLSQVKNFLQRWERNEFAQAEKQWEIVKPFLNKSVLTQKASQDQALFEQMKNSLYYWTREMDIFTTKIGQFEKSFLLFQEKIAPTRSYFAVYNAELSAFDYPRALKAKLLFDHLGASPSLEAKWYTKLAEQFFAFLMLVFKISMPLHILLIFYCRARLGEQ